jgi:hypothetical protein
MQMQHPVASAREVKVMGDDEGGELIIAMKLPYQLKDQFRSPIVQVAGWLIRHQNRRSGYQRPGQSNSLLFAP